MTTRAKNPVSREYLLTVFCTGFVSLLAELVGVLSPVWVVRKSPELTVSEGIWYARACHSFHACVVSSRELIINTYMAQNHTADFYWAEYQAESSVALALTMAACACFLVSITNRGKPIQCVSRAQISGCLTLLAASILIMLVVVRVGQTDLYVAHPTERWSLNTAAVGGCIGIGGVILSMGAQYKIIRHRQEVNRRHRRDRGRRAHGSRSNPTPMFTVPVAPPEYSVSPSGTDCSHSDTASPPRYEDIYLSQQEEMEAAI